MMPTAALIAAQVMMTVIIVMRPACPDAPYRSGTIRKSTICLQRMRLVAARSRTPSRRTRAVYARSIQKKFGAVIRSRR